MIYLKLQNYKTFKEASFIENICHNNIDSDEFHCIVKIKMNKVPPPHKKKLLSVKRRRQTPVKCERVDVKTYLPKTIFTIYQKNS